MLHFLEKTRGYFGKKRPVDHFLDRLVNVNQ